MTFIIDQNLAQQVVNTVKEVSGQNINFINPNGMIIASTNESRIGSYHEIGHKAAVTGGTIEVDNDLGFTGTQKGINLPVYYHHDLLAVIGISGEPEQVRKYAQLAVRITILLIRERQLNAFSRTQEEKKGFLIQALTTNTSVNHQYLLECLDEFSVNQDTDKRILLIRMNQKYNPANSSLITQKIEQLFDMLSITVFTYNYPNEYVAMFEESQYVINHYLLSGFSGQYKEILKVAVGKTTNLYALQESYSSAITAWKTIKDQVGSLAIFDDLLLDSVLASVDTPTRDSYLKKTLAALTDADIELLRTYYQTDMSLQSTCEKMYLHKNTIQQKLNRIYEKTDLNPRNFRDAVVFYVALQLQDLATSSLQPPEILG